MDKKFDITSDKYKQTQRRNSNFLKALRKKATKEELIVKEYLESLGIRFIFQKGFLKPFHRIVDFYLPRANAPSVIIEVDGGYHKDFQWKDEQKDIAGNSRGFMTLRIQNEDVLNGKYKEIIAKFLDKKKREYITLKPDIDQNAIMASDAVNYFFN